MSNRRKAIVLLGLLGAAITASWLSANLWIGLATSLLLTGLLIFSFSCPADKLAACLCWPSGKALQPHLSNIIRFARLILTATFGMMLLKEWFFGAVGAIFLLGILLLVLLAAACGLWIVSRGIFNTFNKEQSGYDRLRGLLVTLATPALLAVSMGIYGATGLTLGIPAKLLVMQSHYESLVAESRSQPLEAERALYDKHGTTFYIDYGPPVRVAFPGGIGFLDNWAGIVYDPTGDVMLADGWEPDTGVWRAPNRITKLFDGDLIGCTPLWGHYYHCRFT